MCNEAKPRSDFSNHQLNVMKHGGRPAKCLICCEKNRIKNGSQKKKEKKAPPPANPDRICPMCKETKPKSEFTKSQIKKNKSNAKCKKCTNSVHELNGGIQSMADLYKKSLNNLKLKIKKHAAEHAQKIPVKLEVGKKTPLF